MATRRLEALRGDYTPEKLFKAPAMEVIDKLKTVYSPMRGKDQGYTPRESPDFGACRCAYELFLELDCIHEDVISRVKMIAEL